MAYVKLSEKALKHNLETVSKKAGGSDKIAAVLKDNAYGHGIEGFAKKISRLGIKKAVVRTYEEALKIADFFPYILILSDTPRHDSFHYAINDLDTLQVLEPGTKVHLKIDTGMHRNGIALEEIEKAFELLQKNRAHLTGVFTHFRSADELSSELFWQNEQWQTVKQHVIELIKKYNLQKPLFHAANSAALFRLGCEDDFARIGIALYGYTELDDLYEPPALEPVASLWAQKIASRELKKGSRVGYGGVFEAREDMIISTYDAGYADGIFRFQKEIEDGKILGRVSMDSILLEGEKKEICIFSDAKKMARKLGTISYELLVKMPAHLSRTWID
ncbi:alanine racemase [Nitratiruptor sp. SB155-2]|uniref:Alanine racemase n=1 Tax=Nitratiruptor sp. (strain SB155-2) TaxID=387092 RepID=ALR_NITSB|nr:alanine racemase [Nitratiruptor sp. SB155-2]A6Q1W0.1 RecName: Full=Alanine racemase [Nitratiruptor sp. SB155-2]BAF69469.1 alanine racemase [Nitratiruptor sp. SB155-2]